MPKQNSGPQIEIPYVLDSPEKIIRARELRLLRLPLRDYENMLSLAQSEKLLYPSAFKKAKKVQKDVLIAKENIKTTEMFIDTASFANMDFIESFEKVAGQLPDLKRLAKYRNIFRYLQSLPADIRGLFYDPSNSLDTILEFLKFLKKEILLLSRTKRTGNVHLKKLKEMILAYTLFLPENEHLLKIITAGGEDTDSIAAFQNTAADLLFFQSEKAIRQITSVSYKTVKEKLFSKLAKTGLSARQKIFIFNSLSKTKDPDVLIDKTAGLIQKAGLDKEKLKKIKAYILSQKNSLKRIRDLHQELFMTRELQLIKDILKAKKINPAGIKSYRESVIKTITTVSTMSYFPCKDYLDAAKHRTSLDCTSDNLAVNQLLSPEFFNIRLFDKSGDWIGNIYILDFTDKDPPFLLVDRIQIPRDRKADFIDFFDNLKEVFTEMFKTVSFKYIVCPLAISNHKFIQKLWHSYRNKRKLPAINLKFRSGSSKYFESLSSRRNYHILFSKNTPQGTLFDKIPKK